MSSKAKFAIFLTFVIVAGAILAGVGFWDIKSPHYWRAHAQTALLSLAESVPLRKETVKLVEALTKASLSIHLNGVSTDEMEKAATLLQRIGKPAEASTLLLGLTNYHASKLNTETAQAFAKRSLSAWPSLEALVSLVVLHLAQPAEQIAWVRKLQREYPYHEMSVAWACTEATYSLQYDPPASCNNIPWIRDRAWRARNEDFRLAAEIAALPEKAAQEIAKSQAAIQEHASALPAMSSQVQTLTRERDNLGWAAVGEVLIDRLPIPKPGDTTESYLTREAICAAKWINPICIAASIANATDRKSKNEARINGEIKNLTDWYNLKQSIIADHRRSIEDWQSNRPFERLAYQRSLLLGEFKRDVIGMTYSRHPTLGAPPDVAVASILAAPQDWVQTALAVWKPAIPGSAKPSVRSVRTSVLR